MFKLVLEKAEEPEINMLSRLIITFLPRSKHPLISWLQSPSAVILEPRKISISTLLIMPKPLTLWITINWKILKDMGIPDHLTCLLRNLNAGQEATVRTGHGTTDWFQIGKGVHQDWILSPCLFNLYAEYIMRNARLESRLPGEISITSDMQMTPLLWQKVKRN